MTIADFVTVEWAPASDPTSTTPTWVDITSIVMEVVTGGGRSGVFDLYGPRTATIRCRNGTKSPAVGPTFDIAGFYRWRQIRVVSTTLGEPLFTGYILSVLHDQTNSPFHGEVTIECSDKLGVFAQAEFNAGSGNEVNGIASAVTLTEAATAALANAALDTTANVARGSTAFFKYPDTAEGDNAPTGNVLQWLQSVLEGEVGGVQVSSFGDLVVSGRWNPFGLTPPGFVAAAVFSDTPGVGEHKYLRQNLTFASTDTDYYNRGVAKSALWSPTFEVSNVPSGYPVETISRTDLPFIYQSWAEANALLYTTLYSTPFTYPRSLTVFAASQSAEQPIVAASVLQSITSTFADAVVQIKHTPAGDTQQTYTVTVENCRHTITPTLWTCELGFASLDRWMTAYGDGTATDPLVVIDGDPEQGIDVDAITAP